LGVLSSQNLAVVTYLMT